MCKASVLHAPIESPTLAVEAPDVAIGRTYLVGAAGGSGHSAGNQVGAVHAIGVTTFNLRKLTADPESVGASATNLFTAQVSTFLFGVACSFAASITITGIVIKFDNVEKREGCLDSGQAQGRHCE